MDKNRQREGKEDEGEGKEEYLKSKTRNKIKGETIKKKIPLEYIILFFTISENTELRKQKLSINNNQQTAE